MITKTPVIQRERFNSGPSENGPLQKMGTKLLKFRHHCLHSAHLSSPAMVAALEEASRLILGIQLSPDYQS